MPDTPKNPADDEARRRSFDDWWNSRPPEWNSKVSFDAGWRAAMVEVEKDRADDGLVAQLRKAANEGIVTATDYQTSQPHRMRISLCGKAADEIERLRAGQPDPDILALARSKAPGITAGRGSEVEQAGHEKTVALIHRLHRALVLTRADAERHGGPYGTQARCVVAIREALRWLAKTDR